MPGGDVGAARNNKEDIAVTNGNPPAIIALGSYAMQITDYGLTDRPPRNFIREASLWPLLRGLEPSYLAACVEISDENSMPAVELAKRRGWRDERPLLRAQPGRIAIAK